MDLYVIYFQNEDGLFQEYKGFEPLQQTHICKYLHICLKPKGVNLWNFKLRLFDLTTNSKFKI